MRRRRALLACLLGLFAGSAAHADGWSRYIAPDKSFSVHYPAGWKATQEGAAVEFRSGATGEEVTLAPLPLDLGATARAIAEKAIDLLRQGDLPGLTVKEWRDSSQPEAAVTFVAAYTEEDRPYLTEVLVARTEGLGLWLSYSVPEADFSPPRSQALLTLMLGSLAQGDQSRAPDAALPDLVTQQSDRNGRAFLFVLEFAMGTPLSTTQESLVVDAFKASMAELSLQERTRFDEYPKVMAGILALQQAAVEPLRRELRQRLREALQESREDPVITVLTEQLDRSAKVVAPGPPPLLAVAAQATGEMLAYGRLLEADPEAMPEDLDPKTAAAIRDQTTALWAQLDDDTRKLAIDAPGMWMVIRTVLHSGAPVERAQLKEQVRALASAQVEATQAESATSASASDSGSDKPMSWAAHNTLMQMQQTTFNTHMWSQGYQGWTPMGKMW